MELLSEHWTKGNYLPLYSTKNNDVLEACILYPWVNVQQPNGEMYDMNTITKEVSSSEK